GRLVRGRRAMASGVPSARRRFLHRRHAVARRFPCPCRAPHPRRLESDAMKIINPATGGVLIDVVADNAKSVRAKYDRARKAQPKWAATPIRKRLAVLRKFRDIVVERMPELARTLSLEVGKPIRQSRNELNGLTGRINFFLAETERALRDEKVFSD